MIIYHGTLLSPAGIYIHLKLRCPEKSRNNAREKISYFCLRYIANQLLTCRLPLALLGQVDEWTAKRSQFSIQVVCWIRIADRQWGSNFPRRGRKPLKEKLKVAYSVALVWAFLSPENEIRQLEDFPLSYFGRLPERLLLSVRTKWMTENFSNWKLRPLLFL